MQYEGIHGGIGTFLTFKERADFDNAVLELPGVHRVYVNFTRQSLVYAVSDNYRPSRKRDVSLESQSKRDDKHTRGSDH